MFAEHALSDLHLSQLRTNASRACLSGFGLYTHSSCSDSYSCSLDLCLVATLLKSFVYASISVWSRSSGPQ